MSADKGVDSAVKPARPKNFTLARAFGCALRGMLEALRNERNVKIDAVAAVLVIAAGFFFQVTAIEWCALMLCIALVASLEIVNTAIEAVVDLASPDYRELARRAKDCAAGAVFFAALCACVVGLIIFVPHVASLLG